MMSEVVYVFVCEDENAKDEGVELPAEDDGTLLLSVLQSQFNGCSGLKYRNPLTGTWRAVKLVNGFLQPPDKGWGDAVYVVVKRPVGKHVSEQGDGVEGGAEGSEIDGRTEGKLEGVPVDEFSSLGYSSDGYKRKLEDSEGQRASKNPRSDSPDNYQATKPASPAVASMGASPSPSPYRNQEDLIILGLEWTVTDQELRNYFAQFGELSHCEVKKDLSTGRSRGFGFVRYGDRAVQASVFQTSHTIKGRRVELKYPKQSVSHLPNKLFIGCLPLKPEVTNVELTEYFSQYGRLTDVYIPRPYRGFGFVTFTDAAVAQKVLNMRHTIRKSTLNVSFADPKGGQKPQPAFPTDPYGMQLNYAAAHVPRVQGGMSPRYPFTAQHQPQQQQAYINYAPAIPRADTVPNPSMGTPHAVPVSSSPGLLAVSYSSPIPQQQQQQPYDRSSAPAYR